MFKELIEDEFLNKLGKEFYLMGATLYVVGGRVRDLVLNTQPNFIDTDICGKLNLTEVKEMATRLGADFKIKNKKLQTGELAFCGNKYEYARLRREEYKDASSHNPTKIEFIDDVYEDAKRRDFTINSLYYDTHNRVIIDPTASGLKDLTNKTIRCAMNPNITLSRDPARIIRMVEIASRLGFKIEPKTLTEAKKFAHNVFGLTTTRLKLEMGRIIKNSNSCYYKSSVKNLLKELKLENLIAYIE